LLAHEVSLFAYHLPLDAHAEWGNNAQLGRVLGLQADGRFGEQDLGFVGGWGQPVLGPEALFWSGALAATVVTWFTFLPSFIFILAGGPLVESTHGKLHFTAPLAAISAAVVGVIASLALFFIVHLALPTGATGPFDAKALTLAAVAAVALLRYKVGIIPVIAACAVMGWLASLFV